MMVASTNLDLVRSIFAAWERGDFSSAEWAHPDIEFVRAEAPDEPSPSTGLAGMAQSFREFLSAWEGYRVEVDEYREIDDERIVVLVRNSGHGKASGVDLGEVRTKGATLFDISGGKVTRLVIHWDRERALADLGLKE
jgi:ketosteroid isomerase-like protein